MPLFNVQQIVQLVQLLIFVQLQHLPISLLKHMQHVQLDVHLVQIVLNVLPKMQSPLDISLLQLLLLHQQLVQQTVKYVLQMLLLLVLLLFQDTLLLALMSLLVQLDVPLVPLLLQLAQVVTVLI